MPAWTDDQGYYLPFEVKRGKRGGGLYRSSTRAFGMQLECQSSEEGTVDIVPIVRDSGPALSLSLVIQDEALYSIGCEATHFQNASQVEFQVSGECPEGPTALELVTTMAAQVATAREAKSACKTLIAASWLRSSPSNRCLSVGASSSTGSTILRDDALTIACRPRLVTKNVTVTVDANNIVSEVSDVDSWHEVVTEAAEGLMMALNTYIIDGSGIMWHNDSYSSDWNNYIMQHISGGASLLDPHAPVPAATETIALFQKAYSKISAILLGSTRETLWVTTRLPARQQLGQELLQETRIFISRPMFIVAQAILVSYTLVAIAIYAQRPGRYLVRLPTSLASVITMFAASRALDDIKEVELASKKGRHSDIENIRFGYGTFFGTDRKVHVGIEREPFVTSVIRRKNRSQGRYDLTRWRVWRKAS
ncbi:hypothetical protein LTR37_011965 [Vermiconidia calcicola]|uniref:Uncharacterized protein n=1 Tax=Vermiconidia calcicola TaxID=1690605 RepID=A0ACC3N0T5_9PEZI|nr:hypothetical protein LTR37_011965 [Vermiconidia calcicola]